MSRQNKTKYLNYSSSKLKHFFNCPMALHLSRQHKPVFGTSTKSVMEAGLLFEGYVLGFKDRTEAELIGRKKKPTIDKIKGHAETVAGIFAGYGSGFTAGNNYPVYFGMLWPDVIDIDAGFIRAFTKWISNCYLVLESGTVDYEVNRIFLIEYMEEDDKYIHNHYGESYKFVTYDHDELQATIRGEKDYIGYVDTPALEKATGYKFSTPVPKAIWDVKYTGNIPRIWDWKFNKEDYLQAVMYTYLHFKTTGEHLPFYYLVVEAQYERPIVRCIRIDVTEEDWQWLERIIAETNNGFNVTATPSEGACLGGRNSGRCWFLEHCKYGRTLCGGFETKQFSDLPSRL